MNGAFILEWLHAVAVNVVDAKSGQPVDEAVVRIESEKDPERHRSANTTRRGRAECEFLETVIRKSGFHDATPHQVVVTAKGFQPGKLSGIEVRRRLNLTVRLHPSADERTSRRR